MTHECHRLIQIVRGGVILLLTAPLSALSSPPTGGAPANTMTQPPPPPGSPATKQARHEWAANVSEYLQWHAHAPSWKAFSNIENTSSAGDFEI